MPGLLVGIILIASLLLVHFSLRHQPMPENRPLDVDDGLPLPEVGQASTVFSLTALFGAYFGVALLLGIPALIGVAFGTALGLFLIRYWIDKHNSRRFETFLTKILHGDSQNVSVYVMVISGVQCLYAASELVILREIAKISFGLSPEQATFLAVGIGIVGYFYVLFGGYMAVFRTDILQFFLVGAMGLIFGSYLFELNLPPDWASRLLPRPGYWGLGELSLTPILYSYHFIIGAIMGMGLLLGSPDTWKRVFLVSKSRKKSRVRFVTLVGVGIAPYLILVPFALTINPIPDGEVNAGGMFSALLTNNTLFIAAVLGLTGSFLSAFDSALLASVHLGLILRRKKAATTDEITRFHWLMVSAVVTLCLLFIAFSASNNPYLLGYFLLGAYSLIAGVQIGSRGMVCSLPNNSLLWIFVVGLVAWVMLLNYTIGFPLAPTTYQLNAVPLGVLFFLLAAITCQFLTVIGAKNDRNS